MEFLVKEEKEWLIKNYVGRMHEKHKMDTLNENFFIVGLKLILVLYLVDSLLILVLYLVDNLVLLSTKDGMDTTNGSQLCLYRYNIGQNTLSLKIRFYQ